jgi:hypothetical protein
MPDDDELYLVWSNEHKAWWAGGRAGYVPKVSQAGRYSRAVALTICSGAIVGTSERIGMLPEIPVRASDAVTMVSGMSGEPWR